MSRDRKIVENFGLPEYATFADLPLASAVGSEIAFVQDVGKHYVSNNSTWTRQDTPKSIELSNVKEKSKLSYKKAALIQAPLWAALTVYASNTVVRHSNGMLMNCYSAGTSLASEPTYTETGQILESGGPSWAALGIASRVNNDGYPVPTVTCNGTIPTSAVVRKSFDDTLGGAILGASITAGGTLYTDGVYTNVPLTNINATGTGATALSITVASGAITAVKLSVNGTGTGYLRDKTLSVAAASIGGTGSGFIYTVTSVLQANSPLYSQPNTYKTVSKFGSYSTSFVYEDGNSSNPTNNGFRIVEFETDDPWVGIAMYGTVSTTRIKIDVDGYPIEEGPTPYDGTTTSYMKISWNGVRKIRKYRLEIQNTLFFIGVAVLPSSYLGPVINTSLLGVYVGDSYGVTVSPNGKTASDGGLAMAIFRRLGIPQCLDLSIGGTGYLGGKTASNDNADTNKYNHLALLNNNLTPLGSFSNVSLVICASGFNDKALTVASVIANAMAVWTKLRTLYPNAIIEVFGPWCGNTGPSAQVTTLDTALAAAHTTWADQRSSYHSIAQASTGAWVSGTGTLLSPSGTGNSDFYTGIDGQGHPTGAGKEYLMKRMIDKVETDIKEFGIIDV